MDGLGPEGLIVKGSSTTNMDDDDFDYDHKHFCKYKAYHRFKYYDGC